MKTLGCSVPSLPSGVPASGQHKRNSTHHTSHTSSHMCRGVDFRQEYQRLGELRAALPGVPVMALTATATPQVQTG